MTQKILKYTFRIVAVFLLLIAGNSGMLFLWLVNAPREIPYINARIERAFNDFSPDYRFTLGRTVVQWDGAQEGLGIHLNDVAIRNQQDAVLAEIPDIEVNLDFFSLLLGSIEFRDVVVTSPRFVIKLPQQPADAVEVAEGPIPQPMGPFPVSAYRKAMIDLLTTVERNNQHMPVRDIRMKNVVMVMDKGAEEISWRLPSFSIGFVPTGGVLVFNSAVTMEDNGHHMRLEAEGFLGQEQTLNLKAKADGLTPGFIVNMLPEVSWFGSMEMLLDAEAELRLNPKGQLSYIRFKAMTDSFTAPELKQFSLAAEGEVTIHDEIDGHARIPEIAVKADLRHLPVRMLQKFWPPEYGKNAREWLVSHILEGEYDTAKLAINISPQEFIANDIADDSVEAHITFSDIKAAYYELFPALIRGKGEAIIRGKSADIDIDYATFGESFLSGAEIKILDLDADDVRMEINGRIVGAVQDLLSFQVMSKDSPSSQMKPSAGTAETEFFVGFPLLSDLDIADVKMRVSSRLQGLAVADVVRGVALSEGDFNLDFDGKKLAVHGNALLGSLQSAITYTEHYGEKPEFRQQYILRAFATPQELASLGMSAALAQYINGAIGLDITITQQDKGHTIALNAALDEVELTVAEAGWVKPVGQKAALKANLTQHKKGYRLESFSLSTPDAAVSGRGTVAPEPLYLDLNVEKAKFGRNDFNLLLTVDSVAKIYRVGLNGESVDAAAFIEHMLQSGSEDKTEGGYASDILINTHTLHLANDVKLTGVASEIHCNVDFCESARFIGTLDGGGIVSANYASIPDMPEETRQLVLRSDNAGAVFSGLGIFTQIKGGWLEASAISDPKGKGLYEGKLIARGFKVVKAPLLGKLLTLASLTGVVDLLAGDGISFKKLGGQFSYDAEGQININEMDASGNSIGITLDGIINTKTDQLKLEGAVVPAYSINSLLGDLPLIGDTLIGKKGEGIIATRYGVEGTLSDPKISVNPLTMLTPGFLRRIWGDASAPEKIAVPETGN